ncbi:MAG: glycosyltransferase family 39 protein [Planctomycetes bacterium]|nr:glycosyltransferase family 39 protein [Planctomycetota bacterium]
MPSPRSPLVLVGVALTFRAALGVLFHLPAPLPEDPEWAWAFEQGAVAQALLRGEGFADPFAAATGPTAWTGPIYPLVLAAVLGLAGGINETAQLLLAGLQVLLSALVVLPLLTLGRRVGRPGAGAVAAWLWALHPVAAPAAVAQTWDATLAALLLTTALAAAAARPAGRALVGAGAWLGLAALLKPVALTAAVPLALAAAGGRGRIPREVLRAIGLYALGVLLLVGPWMARNAVVLGRFAPKMNLGLELLVGNNDFADGQYWAPFHTSQSPNELSLYRKLGEAAYGDDCMRRARTWIREHPERFRELTALRARHFWIGTVRPPELLLGSGSPPDWKGLVKWWAQAVMGVLGLVGALLWRGAPGSRWLVTGVVLTYPLVYLVTHATGRYRLPLEPLLTLAAAALVLGVAQRLVAGREALGQSPSGAGPADA